jgi:hypothetical protein
MSTLKAQVIRDAHITRSGTNLNLSIGPLIRFTDPEAGTSAIVGITESDLDRLGDKAAIESVRAQALEALHPPD